MTEVTAFLASKRAIIYDMDNTLVATDAYVQEHLQETLNTLGVGPLFDLRQVKKVQKENLPFEEIFKKLFKEKGEQILAEYRRTAFDKPFFPASGALNFVQEIKKQGKIQGVLTNRTRMAEERLKQAGFEGFDFILCLPPEIRKPHSRAFENALNWLKEKGLSSSEILALGDHVDDFLSAKEAGIDFIGILNGLTTKEDFLAAGLTEKKIASDFNELSISLNSETEIKSSGEKKNGI